MSLLEQDVKEVAEQQEAVKPPQDPGAQKEIPISGNEGEHHTIPGIGDDKVDEPSITPEQMKKVAQEASGDTDEPKEPATEEQTQVENNEADGVEDSTVADNDSDKADPESPSSQEIDVQLVARAKDLGISEDDLKGFGSDEQIAKSLTLMEKQLLAGVKQAQPQQEQTQAPVEEKPKEGQEQPKEQTVDFEFKADDSWDEETTEIMKENFNGMKQAFDQQVASLQNQVASVVEYFQRQQGLDRVNKFDERINALGDEYAEKFGKGTIDTIVVDSTEYNNRKEVYDAMAALADSLQARGRAVPSEDRLFQMALRATFGDIEKKQARQEIVSKIKKTESKMTARPTSRVSARPTGREATIEALRQEMHDKGISN